VKICYSNDEEDILECGAIRMCEQTSFVLIA